MRRVFLSKLVGTDYTDPLRDGLAWVGLTSRLSASSRVCIKPNLTFPSFRPGVMTNPEAVESVVRILKDYTSHITICESDSGGYNRFSMDEVFRKTGLVHIAARYGVNIVNTSKVESRPIRVEHGWRKLSVPLPVFLLDNTDVFLTLPVPKIHMNTIVSMSVKNQWGVIQEPAVRLKLHPYFWRVIYEVNKALPSSFSIIDGRYGLNRSGPMAGDVIELNWVLVSNNIYAADLVCCHLMGIDIPSVPYLQKICREEGLKDLQEVSVNCDLAPFISKEPFHLKRAWTDYPGLFAFKSRTLAYLGYESPLASILHRLLYLFREPFYDYEKK